MQKSWSVAITVLSCLWLCGVARSVQADAEASPVPHPERLQHARPAGGVKVAVNPPALLWPVSRGKDVRYGLRLSQDPSFPSDSTTQVGGLRWAMFNPPRPLASGSWYWQVAVAAQAGKPMWSATYRFEVDEEAPVLSIPPASDFLAACRADRPRLLISSDALPGLRSRLEDSRDAAFLLKRAERYLGFRLPEASSAEPSRKGANARQAKSFARWASKAFAGRLRDAVATLAPAYLITGDTRYGREAIRIALSVAGMDPDGVTSPRVSDFADGSCMRAMALAYDSAFDLLSAGERARLEDAMAARARRFFAGNVNNLEARVFNAHVWQHILAEFAEIAITTIGAVPDAELWASYVYELWNARVPLLGGADGGWANGINYFGTNIETLLVLPTLFGRQTGADFYRHPWYRNVIHYQLYSWPPGSASDSFGDGAEREARPSVKYGYFAETLSRRFDDPHGAWYAKKVLEPGQGRLSLPLRLEWHRLCQPDREPVHPEPPTSLPQARAFRDIGVVSMHTALGEVSRDLMIAFRSSPFGAFNHMHACQNSFNVLYGGERVLSNSGYYIAYGDEHFRGWYKDTRGHNSVLIDGKGQAFGSKGYGCVLRFLHGDQISYCMGDASSAYPGTGLKTFRRHVVFLRPTTIVVYDELAADHPARWSWLLHSKARMAVEGTRPRLTARTKTARAQVDAFGSAPLTAKVDNTFDPPAVNWREKRSRGKVVEYSDQWHAALAPLKPMRTMRFLTVVQVLPEDNAAPDPAPRMDDRGHIHTGAWRIDATLDPEGEASLLIERRDEAAFLAVDRPLFTVGSRQYNPGPGTSILSEASGSLYRECHDEVP